MNQTASTPKPGSVRQIVNEISELVQQQIDALQEGLAEDDLKQYLQRRGQIDDLQKQLRSLRPRAS